MVLTVIHHLPAGVHNGHRLRSLSGINLGYTYNTDELQSSNS